jgi:hypothetical protein
MSGMPGGMGGSGCGEGWQGSQRVDGVGRKQGVGRRGGGGRGGGGRGGGRGKRQREAAEGSGRGRRLAAQWACAAQPRAAAAHQLAVVAAVVCGCTPAHRGPCAVAACVGIAGSRSRAPGPQQRAARRRQQGCAHAMQGPRAHSLRPRGLLHSACCASRPGSVRHCIARRAASSRLRRWTAVGGYRLRRSPRCAALS